MKKKILLTLIITLMACMLMFTLSACGDKTPQITGITVSGQAEVYIDEFDYTDYTITATYDNGTTEDIELLAEHLSKEDNAKISTVGTHTLTITYSGKTATLSLTVKNHDFDDVTFNNKTVTYNGLPQTIEVSGLPSGASVNYTPNNTYTEVGEYPVTATITKQYYNDLQITATLKITNIMRKITFVQAGVEDIVKEVVDGGTLSEKEIPTPQEVNGYEVKWNRTDFTNITDNITVEVVKSLKTYKIEYVLYDGENDKNNPLSYNVESYDIIIRAPQKEGFTFDGWYLENSFNNKTTKIETGSYGDIKLYAKWKGNVNGLNFNGNGNTSGSMNAVALKTGETKAIPLNTFVKTGYTFKGWSTSANGDVIYNDCADYTMGTESQYTIYAVWEANLNTLTFNGNGATSGSTSSMQIKSDETATLNQNGFTKTGYHFIGWAERSNGTVKYTNGVSYTMGLNSFYTLYAVWEENVNGLNFDGNGNTSGSMNAVTLKTDETKAIPLNTFVKTGYTFKGWSTSANGDVIYNDCANYTMGTDSEYTLYAVWEANLNTLIFNGNSATGGSTSSMQIRTDASKALNANGFTRAGYTFKGWSTSANGTVEFEDGDTYLMGTDSEYTLYAVWDIVKYNIAYVLDDGENSSENPLYITHLTSLPIALSNAYKTGYTFGGWYLNKDFLGSAITEITELKEITLYALWLEGSEGLTYSLLNGEYSVTGYEGTDDIVVIPSTYNDFKVTKIENDAFSESKIKSITIGENIAEIGSGAFSNCYELLEIIYNAINCEDSIYGTHNGIFSNCGKKGSGIFVTIGKNAKRIPKSLFSPTTDGNYFPNIISVEFEENSICEDIGEYAFYRCSNIKKIILSESIRKIGLYAFSGVPSPLEYNNLYYIGTKDNPYFVVKGFRNVSSKFEIHKDTRIIHPRAFAETTDISKITIPENICYIGEQAFYRCRYLTEINYNVVNYPDFTSFSHNIFYEAGMRFGYKLNIGCNVKNIPAYLFGASSRAYIEEIIFEQNSACEKIGEWAFSESISLTEFTIPKKVKLFSGSALYGCESLENIQVETGNTTYKSINGSIYSMDEKILIRYAPGTELSGTGIIELPNVEIIGKNSIGGCHEHYWKIIIPKSVKKIEDRALYSEGIERIFYEGTIDQWVEIEFESGFKNGIRLHCDNSDSPIVDVVLSSAKKISSYAFSGITIKSIEIPNTVESIGEDAFVNCTSLETVKMADGVKSIGESTFSNCSSLTNITIGNGVESIGDYAFAHCSSLTNIIIPNSVTSIGYSAFWYCGSLTSIEIPNSVISIDSRAFEDCSSLKTVYYKGTSEEWNKITIIGSYNKALTNATRYYNYGEQNYTYKFNVNGGQEVADITSNLVITLPTPAKENWYFGGWYDNAEFAGTAYFTTYYGSSNTTLYAKWLTEEEYYAGSSFEKSISITSGESITVTIDTAGEIIYYKFIPTESKSYTIKSSGGLNTFGYLFDSNRSQLTYNDGSTDFTITHSLTAGETYYIVVKMYSSSVTGTFTVSIT